MSRNNQIVRVLSLFFLLCRHRKAGISLQRVCELMAISRRTLYRDLDALKEVGIEIDHVRDDDCLRFFVKKIPFFD